MALPSEKDCTLKCRSADHAKRILTCAIKATPAQIRSYSVWLCHNFTTVTDNLGRNILHLVASCGKDDVVEWLLQQCSADVDVKDLESGWTALHRSFFHGHLASALKLINHGANLRSTDHDGFTPLDLILKDRLPYVEYLPTNPSEVYAWGSNYNYSLGLCNPQGSTTPEILEVFRKEFINIKQVVVCKFHSVFLSDKGKVFTCGYGFGGRLGQGSENTCLVPSPVKIHMSSLCVEVAAGQDHLLLLFEDGQVMSCGLNAYHQLGHNPPVERLLVLKPISPKFLRGKKVIGVRAARFHSVIITKDAIYTFGLNAGQLGHPKGEFTHIVPKQVSCFGAENQRLTHVEVSDGATVCASIAGDVYVLHEYQCRKIASRQLEICKLSVVGGHLDSKCGVEVVKEGGALELRVIILTKSGKVFLWRETDHHLRRCLFSSPKQLIISDIHINHHSVAMVTNDNEGFTGHITPFKGTVHKGTTTTAIPVSPTTLGSFNHASSGFNVLLDKEECNFIRVKRLPHIHRGTSVTSDSKGRNFAVLQASPKMGFVELPSVSSSNMQRNMNAFLSESNSQDGLCDIVFEIGLREFAAHKFILASRCDYFRKQFCVEKIEKKSTISIDQNFNIVPEAFEEILKFIYGNTCNFMTPDFEPKWNIKKEDKQKKKSTDKKQSVNSDVLKLFRDACKSLNIQSLSKRLEDVQLENGKIKVVESRPFPNMAFNRSDLLHLCDVNLRSGSGKIFPCHKCILVSRLDYFKSMLGCCWIENSQLSELCLPISSDVLETILDYLYTDKANKIIDSEDTEFLCQLLMVTDQWLISRLKEICEMALVELITLKNAAELLELASVYNSLQLKKSCMEYVCLNLSAVVEAKGLDILSDGVIKDLSLTYRQMIPAMRRRIIMTNLNEPSREDLIEIENSFPMSDDCFIEKCETKPHESKSKAKKRVSSGRVESKCLSPKSRTKTNSESSDKDIVLEILPKVEAVTLNEQCESGKEKSVVEPYEKILKERPPQWIMKYPQYEQAPELDKIMLQEQQNWTVLKKSLVGHEMKPIHHLSQKQKKLLAIRSQSIQDTPTSIPTPKSPPCPWAKSIEPSPPPPSFWETLNKRDLELTNEKSEQSVSPTSSKTSSSMAERFARKNLEIPSDPVISLDDIQKAEEKKLRCAIQPKVKSLDIINIEDQAIEELLALHNAESNPDEKISVCRVLCEVASPIWKKRV